MTLRETPIGERLPIHPELPWMVNPFAYNKTRRNWNKRESGIEFMSKY